MNLGHAQSLQGDFVGAETNFQAALARQPIDPETRRQYASDLALQGRNPEARRQWQIALALKSDVQTRLNYVGLLYQTGDNAQAITQLRRVVTEKPGLSQALNNLAWLLATCGDDRLRNGAEAVRDAEQACALTGYKQAGFLGTLAAAYAEAGRFPEAVSTCQRTIQQARAAGQTQFANINAQLLQLYHAGRPYHAGG